MKSREANSEPDLIGYLTGQICQIGSAQIKNCLGLSWISDDFCICSVYTLQRKRLADPPADHC
jgi:hypothetical protein